jgi:hypothetical protein
VDWVREIFSPNPLEDYLHNPLINTYTKQGLREEGGGRGGADEGVLHHGVVKIGEGPVFLPLLGRKLQNPITFGVRVSKNHHF